ncbi:GGDEF domain-containing protein [Marinicella rhabdoformis]|uniref:GGDEF domain-containing protein n=1 Tax=Marinicella rhabdoformis TaxID=2580566 RepID=UPI001C552C16|nr:GGDEF domain-containing protein [Marinicella rhabdoformis]
MHQWFLQVKSQFHQSLILCLLLCGSVLAQKQLDTRYLEWEKKLNSSPDEVLQILDRSLPQAQNNNYQLAQHHYLYSQAYIALTYPDKALTHAELGLKAIDKQQFPWLYHKIQIAKVIALDYVGDPQQALPIANQVLTWARQKKDLWLLVEALSARGHIYNAMSLSVNALNDFQEAYQLVPKHGGEINQADIAADIALVYEYRSEDELSVPFFKEAVDYHRENNSFLELSVALYGLGRANKNLGNLDLSQQQLEESARLARKVKDYQGEAYALKELAGMAYKQGKTEEAIQMLKTTHQTFTTSNNKFMLLDTNYSLSRIYLSEGKIKLAEQFWLQAKKYLDPEAMPLQSIGIDELQAKILASKGEYEAAYNKLLETVSKKQKIYTESSIKKLNQFRTQFDLNNKEKENAVLQHENEMQAHRLADQATERQLTNWLIIASFTSTLLLAFIVLRSRKNRLKFEYMAQHDALTNMSNRSYCIKQIKQQLEIHHNNSLLLAMLDLDHFKHINDHYGHAVGDEVLIQFSRIFLSHFDQNVITGRFGGEEFLLAMSYGDQHQLKRSLEQFKESLLERINIAHIPDLKVTFSAGISRCRGINDLDKAIHRADMAMYSAKANGRNQIILHREITQ